MHKFKAVLIATLSLSAYSLHAEVTQGDSRDQYYLQAEVAPATSDEVSETALDESGWDGVVELYDLKAANDYASLNKKIEGTAPVDKTKCKPQVGKASWYGGSLQGGPTASGQRFDTHKLTAANKTLPMHTKVRVTNTQNNLSVVVTINDRGPYVRGRVIDLSQAAAEALHIVSLNSKGRIENDRGLAPVEVSCI